MTSRNIVAQEISQDITQLLRKLPAASNGKLAIPAAIKDVNPDWMTPKLSGYSVAVYRA